MTAREGWKECHRAARRLARENPGWRCILAVAGDRAAAAGFGSIRFTVAGGRARLATRQPNRRSGA